MLKETKVTLINYSLRGVLSVVREVVCMDHYSYFKRHKETEGSHCKVAIFVNLVIHTITQGKLDREKFGE